VVLDYFQYLIAPILIIILVLIELLRLHLSKNSIDIIPADAARDNIEAQARFIRALNNFDMVRI
jgi:hypothetical protein